MRRLWSAGLLLVLAMSGSPVPLEKADRLLVNKAKRELILFKGDTVIKTYKIALGRTPIGAKQQQGDGKTPEGKYTISGRNPKSAFHLSLRVSYPDAADRARAAKLGFDPGGDIMIHGLPNGTGAIGALHRLRDWTEGCIAVTDSEIEEIWRLVPDGVPVEIRP